MPLLRLHLPTRGDALAAPARTVLCARRVMGRHDRFTIKRLRCITVEKNGVMVVVDCGVRLQILGEKRRRGKAFFFFVSPFHAPPQKVIFVEIII